VRILITGASGLLGLNICLSKKSDFDVIGIANQTHFYSLPFPVFNLDLTLDGSIPKALDQTFPDLVINCAAMANVDECEAFPEKAARINAEIPGVIAKECVHRSIPLIHISTDAVFDGVEGNYCESDIPNPISVYSRTKYQGELNVLDAFPEALVARVNFFGFSVSGKRSLAEFFLNNLIAGEKVSGFTDIFFSPMYVNDLIEILLEISRKKFSGIYHIVSRDTLSKYAFGLLISKKFALDGNLINPISHLQSDLVAKRSPNLKLDINKLLSAGIDIPNVELAVDHFYTDYQSGLPDTIRSLVLRNMNMEEG
jgi:dTDP-4-dehydrorhamnose reductase